MFKNSRSAEEGLRAGVTSKRASGFDAAERASVERWRSLRFSWGAIARNLGRSEPDVRAVFDRPKAEALPVAKPKPAFTWKPVNWTERMLLELYPHGRTAKALAQLLDIPALTVGQVAGKAKARGFATNLEGVWTLTDAGVAFLERKERENG